MDALDSIAEAVRTDFEAKTTARDQALAQARRLTRHCAHAIRAIHRDDAETAQKDLEAASELVADLRANLADALLSTVREQIADSDMAFRLEP